MNFEFYIAKKITFRSKRSFSKTIVSIAIIAIALSISVMFISIAIVKGFQTEIKEKLTGFSSHIQLTRTKVNYTYESESIIFSQDQIKQIKAFEGVKHVQIFANKPGIITTDKDIEGIILKGVSKDFDSGYISKTMVQGRMPDLYDTQSSNQIVISKLIADRLNLKCGDKLLVYFVQQPPRARKFIISGIYSTGIEELDKVFAICDIRQIQKLNNWKKSEIGGYEIFINDLKNLETLNETIRAAAPFDQDSKSIREIYPQIFDWLNLLNVNVKVILFLMLMVAIVNMTTALLVIIVEKTQMTGILKSLGAKNFSVSKIFMYHASYLIGLGLFIGNLLGIILLYIQYQWQIIKLPPESYYVDHVPVLFTWGYFIAVNILSFLICSLSMLIPAAYVARISPLKTLRFQ